uniref:Uncharacterized protein n=1 Tax=Arundo donax TaxID=35708 RepID=A0A0A9EQW3_ARUDO
MEESFSIFLIKRGLSISIFSCNIFFLNMELS